MDGVLYIVWGSDIDKFLRRSIDSLKAQHPDLPVHVERIADGSTFLDRTNAYDISPFDGVTLMLDSDTVVMSKLDFGFEVARKHHLALCINECPWASRYPALRNTEIIEYNCGVVFFNRSEMAKDVFTRWHANRDIDSRVLYRKDDQVQECAVNDQAPMAKAIWDAGISPFVLPHNWNFRPRFHTSWYGQLKIWHEYLNPPPNLFNVSKHQGPDQPLLEHFKL